jgi:metal-sulfur cluster biosynthetic enzyme
MSIEETKEKIIENLKEVYDPEISVNVYDLGLIYEVKVGEGYCDITMSLTSAFCPAADFIIEDVKGAAMSVGVSMVNVDVVWEPQWGPEMMSEDAKLILGIFE